MEDIPPFSNFHENVSFRRRVFPFLFISYRGIKIDSLEARWPLQILRLRVSILRPDADTSADISFRASKGETLSLPSSPSSNHDQRVPTLCARVIVLCLSLSLVYKYNMEFICVLSFSFHVSTSERTRVEILQHEPTNSLLLPRAN